jgi:ketosteroid isomerase-like protein
MSAQSIELVRGVYEAFGRGDVPGVLGSFDAEIEWHEADGLPYGGVHRGPDAVAGNVFGPITQDIPDFRVAPKEFFDSGDEVVTLGRYLGTGQETGVELDVPFAHAWTVRDGKVVRFRQYVDTVKFNEVLAGQPAT